jgi:hypothetical protein
MPFGQITNQFKIIEGEIRNGNVNIEEICENSLNYWELIRYLAE